MHSQGFVRRALGRRLPVPSLLMILACGLTGGGATAQAAGIPGLALTDGVVTTSVAPAGTEEDDPAVARDADGDGVVAWVRKRDEDGGGAGGGAPGTDSVVIAQRIGSLGNPVGPRIEVGTGTNADVGIASNDSFVIAFDTTLGSTSSIALRRYSASGALIGSQQRVDQSDRIKGGASISVAPAGNFVVTWTEGSGTTDDQAGFASSNLLARRYNAQGVALGGAFVVNTSPGTGVAIDSDVAMADDGRFVIAYSRCTAYNVAQDQETGCDVVFRRYNANGSALGGEVIANSTRTGEQLAATVGMVPQGPLAGSFKLVWEGRGLSLGGGAPDPLGVFERNYRADGTPANAAEVPLSPLPGEPDGLFQCEAELTLDRSGRSLVTWRTFPTELCDNPAQGSYFRLCEAPAAVGATPECFLGALDGRIPFGLVGFALAMDADGDPIMASDGPGEAGGIRLLPLSGLENVDLAVSLSSDPAAPQPGDAITYTATVTNQHPASSLPGVGVARVVRLQFRIDGDASGLSMSQASGPGWACAPPASDGGVDCTLGTPLAPGASSAVTIPALILAEQIFTAAASVSSAQLEVAGITGNNDDSVETDVTLPPLEINFVGTGANVNEGNGLAIRTRSIAVQLSRPTPEPLTVPLLFSGAATLDADYSLPLGASVLIPAGGTGGVLQVVVLDDDLDETIEDVVITLGQPAGAVVGAASGYTLRIADNDAPPTLSVVNPNPAQLRLVESPGGGPPGGGIIVGPPGPGTITQQLLALESGSGFFDVVLDRPSGRAVVVDLSLGGTATPGADYTISRTQVSIAAGQTRRRVVMQGLADGIDEPFQTAVVTLVNPRNATLGAPSVFELVIPDDDDAPVVTLASAGTTDDDGTLFGLLASETGTVLIDVLLDRPSERAINLVLVAGGQNGTATLDQDFTLSGPTEIAPGQTSAQFTVTVIDDALSESNENLFISLDGATDATIGSPNSVDITITDDDALPTVNLVSPGATLVGTTLMRTQTLADRNGGTLVFDVVLDVASGQFGTVALQLGGAATLGVDYTISANVVGFMAGQTTAQVTLQFFGGTTQPMENITILLVAPVNVDIVSPDSLEIILPALILL